MLSTQAVEQHDAEASRIPAAPPSRSRHHAILTITIHHTTFDYITCPTTDIWQRAASGWARICMVQHTALGANLACPSASAQRVTAAANNSYCQPKWCLQPYTAAQRTLWPIPRRALFLAQYRPLSLAALFLR
jgi:hypothetical protein